MKMNSSPEDYLASWDIILSGIYASLQRYVDKLILYIREVRKFREDFKRFCHTSWYSTVTSLITPISTLLMQFRTLNHSLISKSPNNGSQQHFGATRAYCKLFNLWALHPSDHAAGEQWCFQRLQCKVINSPKSSKSSWMHYNLAFCYKNLNFSFNG